MDKDPYLSELDAIDDFDAPAEEATEIQAQDAQDVEEPTHIDVKVPPPPKASKVEEETPEPPPLPPSPSAQGVLDLAPDLAVPLLVVMGRKSFTVQDLLELKLGQIMDLDREPLEPVDLVAGGRVIGKGELVEVDGRIGVRVLKLFK